MNRSNAYSIPVKGMSLGRHEFDFELDGTFFESYENAPVQSCEIKLELEADRRHDMILLVFSLSGVVDCPCDRCLARIKLPINGTYSLIVKLEEEEEERTDNEEVIYIHRETAKLDLSSFFYDFSCLSIPMVRTYDCEEDDPIPCDLKTREFLEQKEETPDEPNPIWDEIKTKLS